MLAASSCEVRKLESHQRASRRLWILAAAAFTIALLIAIGYAATRSPWWDEGLFSDVAVNFRNSAHLRSSLLAPGSYVHLPAPDKHTYWQFPGYLIALGAWLRLMPVSIYSVRLFSVLWGCAFVAAWFLFVRALARSESLALVAVVFIAFDYSVVSAASDGRMDMMCAALGTAALAAYASLRHSHPDRAAVLAGFFGAASLFSHPMGFVMNACIAAVLLCDLRCLRLRFFLLAAIPYAVFGVAALLYILQDPALFLAQTKAISGYRVGGLFFTLASIARDLRDRYLHFYFAPHSGFHRLKIFGPLFGLAGLIALLSHGKLRQPLVQRLVLLLGIAFLGVAAIDNMKFPYYLVYVMPVLAAIGAVWLYESFRRRSRLRFIAAALALAFLATNAANALYYILRNDFAHQYRPAVAQLQRLHKPGEVIMAPSEFGFALGFGPPLIDDCYLGYLSGIRAQLYVQYSSCNPPPGDTRPWLWSRAQLAEHYREVYRNPAYIIYLRRRE